MRRTEVHPVDRFRLGSNSMSDTSAGKPRVMKSDSIPSTFVAAVEAKRRRLLAELHEHHCSTTTSSHWSEEGYDHVTSSWLVIAGLCGTVSAERALLRDVDNTAHRCRDTVDALLHDDLIFIKAPSAEPGAAFGTDGTTCPALQKTLSGLDLRRSASNDSQPHPPQLQAR